MNDIGAKNYNFFDFLNRWYSKLITDRKKKTVAFGVSKIPSYYKGKGGYYITIKASKSGKLLIDWDDVHLVSSPHLNGFANLHSRYYQLPNRVRERVISQLVKHFDIVYDEYKHKTLKLN